MNKPSPKDTPVSLSSFQKQFDRVVREPIQFTRGKFEFQHRHYPKSLCDTVKGRGALTGRERLGIYNAQYWYRLFTVLQEAYPVLCEKLGSYPFNQLAGAYLEKYPSTHPNLSRLGVKLPRFLNEEKRLNPALREIARIENYWNQLYTKAESAAIFSDSSDSGSSPSQLPENFSFQLQSSLVFFVTQFDAPIEVFRYHLKASNPKIPSASNIWSGSN